MHSVGRYDVRKYRWADEADQDTAACIGVVLGATTEEQALELHDADPASLIDVEADATWDLDLTEGGNQFIQIWSEPGRIVVVEPNGWIGIDPDIASALSIGGRYAALYWSVSGDRFIYAENGAVIFYHPETLFEWQHAHPLPESVGLPFFPASIAGETVDLIGGLRAIGFALLDHLTGVSFTDADAIWRVPRPTWARRPAEAN